MSLEQLLSSSLSLNASDLHLHFTGRTVTLQRRIGGKLTQPEELINQSHLINRIKVLANLETSESKKTQEGQFTFTDSAEKVPIRVSIVATTEGEKAALRLLPNKKLKTISKLGMTTYQASELKRSITKVAGLCLVCGATGAGKTTTLYSCLNELNTGENSIYTIEDPAEYQIKGAFQCEPNAKINQTANSLLRSFLRQDPDIVNGNVKMTP